MQVLKGRGREARAGGLKSWEKRYLLEEWKTLERCWVAGRQGSGGRDGAGCGVWAQEGSGPIRGSCRDGWDQWVGGGSEAGAGIFWLLVCPAAMATQK